MILGIGIDLCDVTRIERVLARHGKRFLARVFTEEEQAYALSRPRNTTAILAKRFAAKEACAKALGTGMMQGVSWRDIGVTRSSLGAPAIELKNGALKKLNRLIPEKHQGNVHLSLTDEGVLAQAFVIVSAISV